MVTMEETVLRSTEDIMELLDLTEDEMKLGEQELDANIRAWHLQQLRKSRGLTQRKVAEEMHVSQPRVHEIEHGEVGRAGVDTLRSYIRALGGELQVTATIDGNTYRIA